MRTTLSNTCFLPHLHSQRFGHQMCLSYAGSPHTSHARWIPTHAPGPTHACTGSHACSHRVPRMHATCPHARTQRVPTHACTTRSPRTHTRTGFPHARLHRVPTHASTGFLHTRTHQVPTLARLHWVPMALHAQRLPPLHAASMPSLQ